MTKETTFPFKGYPLYRKIPGDINFLVGDLGEFCFNEFQKKKEEFGNNRGLDVIRLEKEENLGMKVIRGFNPYSIVLMDMILRERWSARHIRIMSGDEMGRLYLEKLADNCPIDITDIILSNGLVLHSKNEPNKYLAEDSYNQILRRRNEARGERKRALEVPVLIDLTGLILEKDGRAPHGLRFKLTDHSGVGFIPVLSERGNYDGLLHSFSRNGQHFQMEDLMDSPGQDARMTVICYDLKSATRFDYKKRQKKSNSSPETITSNLCLNN